MQSDVLCNANKQNKLKYHRCVHGFCRATRVPLHSGSISSFKFIFLSFRPPHSLLPSHPVTAEGLGPMVRGRGKTEKESSQRMGAAGAESHCCDKRRAEPEGKALSLPSYLPSDGHESVGHGRKHKVVVKSGQNVPPDSQPLFSFCITSYRCLPCLIFPQRRYISTLAEERLLLLRRGNTGNL